MTAANDQRVNNRIPKSPLATGVICDGASARPSSFHMLSASRFDSPHHAHAGTTVSANAASASAPIAMVRTRERPITNGAVVTTTHAAARPRISKQTLSASRWLRAAPGTVLGGANMRTIGHSRADAARGLEGFDLLSQFVADAPKHEDVQADDADDDQHGEGCTQRNQR